MINNIIHKLVAIFGKIMYKDNSYWDMNWKEGYANKTDDNNTLLIKYSKEGLDLRLQEYVLPNAIHEEQAEIKKIYDE